MIKIGHSVLALPFAFMGAMLAARGLPDGRTIFYILVAMVGARGAAMAFNRLADARFDALNPRTADRALPAGRVSRRAVLVLVRQCRGFLSAPPASSTGSASPGSPVALVVILGYSLTKRCTAPFSPGAGPEPGNLAPWAGGWR